MVNVISPIEIYFEECCRYKFLKRVSNTRSNHEVVGFVALEHSPHCFDIVRSPAPVAADRQVAERKPCSGAGRDFGGCSGDLAGHKASRPERRFVIEQKT